MFTNSKGSEVALTIYPLVLFVTFGSQWARDNKVYLHMESDRKLSLNCKVCCMLANNCGKFGCKKQKHPAVY